jgi:hypothetical protein
MGLKEGVYQVGDKLCSFFMLCLFYCDVDDADRAASSSTQSQKQKTSPLTPHYSAALLQA